MPFVVEHQCKVNGTYLQGPFATREEAMKASAPEPSNCDIRPISIVRRGTENEIHILRNS